MLVVLYIHSLTNNALLLIISLIINKVTSLLTPCTTNFFIIDTTITNTIDFQRVSAPHLTLPRMPLLLALI